MSMMSIRERILARADLAALHEARDITRLAAALNAEGVTAPRQRFVTARGVMSGCADGVAILTALETAAANKAVKWALTFLGQESGLDIGDPFTQGMILQLVEAGVLSTSQGEQLRALAFAPVVVTQEQVADAMYNPDGTEK